MAKHLLNDADVHALLDQQRRSRMPGIVDPDRADPGLPEESLPGPPVLGPVDRTAILSGEDQIVIRPAVPGPQPFGCLPLAVLLEELQERRRALEREFALALALPKDDAPANASGAFVGMRSTVHRARTLVANMTLPRAARLTGRTVPVLLAALLAGSTVPACAARIWIVTAVPPGETLNLEPCPYNAGLQVHIGPAEAQGLALADAQRKRDRPASTVSLGRCHIQDAVSFLAGQGLDLLRRHGRSIHQGGDVSWDPAAPDRNLKSPRKDAVNLNDRAR
jgi:hypothetical protein